jgi:quinol-cytochrome oxidoreductase complex cytochrome b subunit
VNTRQIVTAVVIVFVAAFAFLTVATAIEHGIDILTIVSLGVLALFVVGILGALSQGPDDR